MAKKVAIIGGGISGVSAANLLKGQGIDCTLFEAESSLGGLIRCDLVDGNLYHLVGGHIFNSKIDTVVDWFWKKFNLKTEFIRADRNAKIFLDRSYIGYPIENHIYQLERDLQVKIVEELLEIQRTVDKDNVQDNFSNFLINSFGSTLYEIYFNKYNSKIWKSDLSKIPLSWLEGKLPMPDINKIITQNILRERENEMVHSSFYYPKRGGSQFIIDRLGTNLNIIYEHRVERIDLKENRIIIDDQYEFDHVIYTGDIRSMPGLLFDSVRIKDDLKKEIASLKSNGTSNLLCTTEKNDLSWLYITDQDLKSHRIIYSGNFSPTNNHDLSRISCTVEFSGKVPVESMKKEIAMLPGKLHYLSHNYEPNSYVIQDSRSRRIIQDTKEILRPKNIHLCGRFAEWEYFNMDMCIQSAMKVTNQITHA